MYIRRITNDISILRAQRSTGIASPTFADISESAAIPNDCYPFLLRHLRPLSFIRNYLPLLMVPAGGKTFPPSRRAVCLSVLSRSYLAAEEAANVVESRPKTRVELTRRACTPRRLPRCLPAVISLESTPRLPQEDAAQLRSVVTYFLDSLPRPSQRHMCLAIKRKFHPSLADSRKLYWLFIAAMLGRDARGRAMIYTLKIPVRQSQIKRYLCEMFSVKTLPSLDSR